MRVTLKGARVSAGMTQEKLAEKLDVSRLSVANWENGKTRISTATLMAFAEVTGFSVDDILLPSESTKSELV